MRLATLCSALGLAMTLGGVNPAPAQQRFDGRWDITVLTATGDCDPAYRYEIIVDRGQPRYAGGGQVRYSWIGGLEWTSVGQHHQNEEQWPGRCRHPDGPPCWTVGLWNVDWFEPPPMLGHLGS
jgi:hypothetical protein